MEENLNPDPMNQGPVNPEPNKKSGKGIFVVVAVMAIIIVVLVAYIMTNGSEKSKESGAENNSTSSSKVSESDEEKDSKDEDETEDEDKKDSEDEEDGNTSKKDKNTSKDDEEDSDKKTSDDEESEDNTSKSGFGKKDKNTANKNKTTDEAKDDKEDSDDKKESTSTTKLSADWKSAEFTLDGKAYKINEDYTKFKANGWYIDLKDAGYEDGYILNKNDKVYSTIDFLNDKFDDADVNVGFINLGETAKDITECQVWALTVDNKYSDTPVEFILPGGIKYGSTLAEVEAAYGKPTDEDDIYRSEDLGYTTYTYDNELEPQLRLTIWDEGGLTKFEYKIY